jgi:Rieske Fe-S protein
VNPWASLYDPSRRTLRALPEFARENLNVAAQYAALFTGGEVESADAVRPGEGAIVGRGTAKVAVYRDPSGTLHERSAVCVHLGCIVAWNDAEKTWDCPCHGSRFDADGRVFQGPANRDLDRVVKEDPARAGADRPGR